MLIVKIEAPYIFVHIWCNGILFAMLGRKAISTHSNGILLQKSNFVIE